MRKILASMAIVAVAFFGSYYSYRAKKYAKEDVPQTVRFQDLKSDILTQVRNETALKERPEVRVESQDAAFLPRELNIKMAFYPQAPFENWDYPWQEACEEASVLLAANTYYDHNWTREEFNEEILKLVEWENKRFGDYQHTDTRETALIVEEYLGLKTKVHEDLSFEEVREIVAGGHFLVMPFDGKKLKNPFYRNGGPIYHVFVVKGYKEGEKLIVNDVGTKRGADYVYSWKRIREAWHDYAEPMSKGARLAIEVFPPEK